MRALLGSAHLGPTLAVTALAALLTVPAGVGPGGRFAVSVPAPTAGTAQMM